MALSTRSRPGQSKRPHVSALTAIGLLATLLGGPVNRSAAQDAPAPAPLSGRILHIVRHISFAGISESWTDAADGLSKASDRDVRGKLAATRYALRQPDGRFFIFTLYASLPRGVAQPPLHVVRAPLVRGHIAPWIWLGGAGSLAELRTIYAAYLRGAGSQVTRVLLHGVPARRFVLEGSTLWVDMSGLPLQEVQIGNPGSWVSFPVIEELPSSALSRAFFIPPVMPPRPQPVAADQAQLSRDQSEFAPAIDQAIGVMLRQAHPDPASLPAGHLRLAAALRWTSSEPSRRRGRQAVPLVLYDERQPRPGCVGMLLLLATFAEGRWQAPGYASRHSCVSASAPVDSQWFYTWSTSMPTLRVVSGRVLPGIAAVRLAQRGRAITLPVHQGVFVAFGSCTGVRRVEGLDGHGRVASTMRLAQGACTDAPW